VVWGARTLDGDDRMASEWKYIPVRRTALYIEESLFRGLKWVVFEPNSERLSQIRLTSRIHEQPLPPGAFQASRHATRIREMRQGHHHQNDITSAS